MHAITLLSNGIIRIFEATQKFHFTEASRMKLTLIYLQKQGSDVL